MPGLAGETLRRPGDDAGAEGTDGFDLGLDHVADPSHFGYQRLTTTQVRPSGTT